MKLAEETDRLLEFARASVHPDGGFAWLDDDGRPELERPVELWITCRMTHVFALAHLMGRPYAAELVDHGIAALAGRFRDPAHGGWYAAVGPDGPVTRTKTAYEHAFVVLAASSAAIAGRPGGEDLLAEALHVLDTRFWDEDAGMVVEEWDESWTTLDAYRGVNANMHTVEALLAVGDVARAERIVTRVVHGFARSHDWRIPEHFDAEWRPVPDYHRDEPAHPFRPYGATVGHWFEWSRLTLALRAALGDAAPAWMLDDAVALFDAGVREGWAVDGAAGFVYTVDWDSTPVVRQRMHWVATEAIAAAATLAQVSGDRVYEICAEQWWGYAERYLVDREHGSWHHELDPANRPASGTWVGKPDVYHAIQATLVPRLPVWPAFARALSSPA
ncbi:N-acyl-D-glucosamine 2-epimerase [Nocardioides sp. Root1257]|uniref:AGE family epimerase/isomerase n=1 Tax=unclassified Nocardioides TaxID=2615069 RepID=UPI0006FD0416|nr:MULTISPECIES: AGE family epimerase/isomerase [unclassified Nocardioides]KQW49208.1 N-acyl-D-glucosamine 2-epimerase [Nocardioides sp. Root1257]KRC48382.1 N-acyl-D-glucosamine 2-epimerase [Nocardioides sp. Root224]